MQINTGYFHKIPLPGFTILYLILIGPKKIKRNLYENQNILIYCIPSHWQPYLKSQDSLTIGIGISLNPNLIFTSDENYYHSLTNPASFYIILNLSHLRFEPEFGYYSYSNDFNYDHSSDTEVHSALKTGLGIVYEIMIESSFKIYLGPRVSWIFSSSKFHYAGSEEDKTTEVDLLFGICTGGEYLFSQHFSIGGEVQLNHISFGEPEFSHPGFSSSSRSAGQTGTNTAMFFRWYF